MVIRMLKPVSENFNRMKKRHRRLNKESVIYEVSEIKNILEGINRILDEVEDRIGYLEDKVAENTQLEQQ